jgi:hypothetical protein
MQSNLSPIRIDDSSAQASHAVRYLIQAVHHDASPSGVAELPELAGTAANVGEQHGEVLGLLPHECSWLEKDRV